jgi:hypothetical protein
LLLYTGAHRRTGECAGNIVGERISYVRVIRSEGSHVVGEREGRGGRKNAMEQLG